MKKKTKFIVILVFVTYINSNSSDDYNYLKKG